MRLKKERNHLYGLSNIDFRSKRDEENIRKFQPWIMAKAFATQGQSNFHLTLDQKKSLFEGINKLLTLKDIVNEHPNPKYYNTIQFYKSKNITLYSKTLTETERAAHLDETEKGKDPFTGDSMMISFNTKLKHKDKNLSIKDKKRKHKIKENISREKNLKNKEAIQETQIVKIDAKNTLEDKVDLKKIKEIRLALRRRYANRTHIRKLYKNWDSSCNGYINLYDAHSMINKLGIPINYNETRALISSASDEEVLRLDDFVNLIHNDNPALNINLKKLEYKSEEEFLSDDKIDELHKKMQYNLSKANNADDIKTLKDFLRVRIPLAIKLCKNKDAKETNFIDINDFKSIISSFKLPLRFNNDSIINPLIEDFKNNSRDKINYKQLIEYIVDTRELNDFYNFKDKYLYKIENKIKSSENQMKNSLEAIKLEQAKKHELFKELEKNKILDIEAKKHKKVKDEEFDKFYQSKINNYQPSKEFNELIFKDFKKTKDKYKEFESKFSAHPSLRKEVVIQTRYGSNPKVIDTKWITQSLPISGSYISEKDRFSQNINYFQEKEKHLKLNKFKNKINNIKFYNDQVENKFNMDLMLKDQKKQNSLLQRTNKLYRYELINKIRNELVE